MQIKLINIIKPLSFCSCNTKAGTGVSQLLQEWCFQVTVGCGGSLLAASSNSESSSGQKGSEKPILCPRCCHCRRTNTPGSCPKKGRNPSGILPVKPVQKTLQWEGGQHFPTQSLPVLCCVYCYKLFGIFPLKFTAAAHPSLPTGRNSFSPVCPHWIQPGHIQTLFFHPKYYLQPFQWGLFSMTFFFPDLQV